MLAQITSIWFGFDLKGVFCLFQTPGLPADANIHPTQVYRVLPVCRAIDIHGRADHNGLLGNCKCHQMRMRC